MKQISFRSLPLSERTYLDGLEPGKGSIPVYYRPDLDSDEIFFVNDFVLTNNKVFEKTAPETLYRGGGVLVLKTDEGLIVLPDERYGWLRPVGGIARFEEGGDLTVTAIREAVLEELAILSVDEKVRFVPEGIAQVPLKIGDWGVTAEALEEVGEIKILKNAFNEKNRSYERVVEWTVPGPIKVLHSEDWYAGGMSGITPILINESGFIKGIYSGRQGLIKIPMADVVAELHPTLEAILL